MLVFIYVAILKFFVLRYKSTRCTLYEQLSRLLSYMMTFSPTDVDEYHTRGRDTSSQRKPKEVTPYVPWKGDKRTVIGHIVLCFVVHYWVMLNAAPRQNVVTRQTRRRSDEERKTTMTSTKMSNRWKYL